MGLITSIEPQKGSVFRKQKIFNVFVDGKFAFSADENLVLKEGIVAGKEVTKEDLERLIKVGGESKFFNLALFYLSRRPRSEKEVLDYLKRKDAGEDVIENIVKRLKTLHFLNDSEFAKWWVERRRERRMPFGDRAIRFELFKKGIAKDTVDNALSNVGEDAVNATELAVKAGSRKAEKLRRLEKWEFRAKLGQFLAGKGFDWDDIKEAVEILWEKWYNKEC